MSAGPARPRPTGSTRASACSTRPPAGGRPGEAGVAVLPAQQHRPAQRRGPSTPTGATWSPSCPTSPSATRPPRPVTATTRSGRCRGVLDLSLGRPWRACARWTTGPSSTPRPPWSTATPRPTDPRPDRPRFRLASVTKPLVARRGAARGRGGGDRARRAGRARGLDGPPPARAHLAGSPSTSTGDRRSRARGGSTRRPGSRCSADHIAERTGIAFADYLHEAVLRAARDGRRRRWRARPGHGAVVHGRRPREARRRAAQPRRCSPPRPSPRRRRCSSRG